MSNTHATMSPRAIRKPQIARRQPRVTDPEPFDPSRISKRLSPQAALIGVAPHQKAGLTRKP